METPLSHAAASIRPLARTKASAAHPPSPRLAEAKPRANPSPPPSQRQSEAGLWLIAGLIALWLIFGRGVVHVIDAIAAQVAG